MSKRNMLFILVLLIALTTLGFSQYKLSQKEKIIKQERKEHSSLEKKLDDIKAHQFQIEKEIEQQNKDITELISDIKIKKEQITTLEEKRSKLQSNAGELNNTIKNLEKRISEQNAQQTNVSRSSYKVAKQIYMEATGYTAYCSGCSGITATGINLRANPNAKVIAVDPRVIPLGTKVWVEGYGYAIAADTGGAIKGNKIDVFFQTKSQAYAWGRRVVLVKILN